MFIQALGLAEGLAIDRLDKILFSEDLFVF